MAAHLDGIFSGDLQNKLKEAKVFVVGAGGIGCELLKNLVLTGFTDIELIDLDTIDVSNLNRQFLFHKQHVGKSKAAVAAESVLQFNPNVKIKYYHDSVIGPKFNKSFFERFNVVLNALDNLPARFHVNRMCLAAGVPLIESGTSGYTGQVELIKGGLSSCYECLTKTLPKDFPGCTIRNTPSEPIHCIVWAKHLFNQLFGEPDEDVSPDTDDPELAGHAAARVLEELASPEKKKAADRKSTREWAKENEFNPNMIFNKLFKEDITYLLSMTDLWNKSTGRKAPIPLSVDQIPDSVAGSSSSKQVQGAGLKDMNQWSIAECVAVFKDSVNALKRKLNEMGEGENLVWDKDDQEAMDFVAACANIRAYIFHIPLKTRFEIKSMAGNIIPAIATTNAIIAGVVVLHALRVLMEKYNECASVYLRQKPGFTNTLLVSEAGLIPPNPNCIVCTKPEVVLSCNLEKMKVKELEEILKKNLNMAAPDVLLKTSHSYIISSEEGETEQNNEKTLSEMGVQDGTCLQADDYLQNYKLEISVKQYVAEGDRPHFLINSEGADLTPKLAVPEKNGQAKKQPEVDENDDLIIMEEEPVVAASGSGSAKRKLNEGDHSPVPPKKRAYDVSSDDITIL